MGNATRFAALTNEGGQASTQFWGNPGPGRELGERSHPALQDAHGTPTVKDSFFDLALGRFAPSRCSLLRPTGPRGPLGARSPAWAMGPTEHRGPQGKNRFPWNFRKSKKALLYKYEKNA